MLKGIQKLFLLFMILGVAVFVFSCTEEEGDPHGVNDEEYPFVAVISTSPDISKPAFFHPDSVKFTAETIYLDIGERQKFYAGSFNREGEKLSYDFIWSTDRNYSENEPNPPFIAQRDTTDLPYGEIGKSCTFVAAQDYGKAEIYATVTPNSKMHGLAYFFVPKANADFSPVFLDATGTGSIRDTEGNTYANDSLIVSFDGLGTVKDFINGENFYFQAWLVKNDDTLKEAFEFTLADLDEGSYKGGISTSGARSSIIDNYKGLALTLESDTLGYSEGNVQILYFELGDEAPKALVTDMVGKFDNLETDVTNAQNKVHEMSLNDPLETLKNKAQEAKEIVNNSVKPTTEEVQGIAEDIMNQVDPTTTMYANAEEVDNYCIEIIEDMIEGNDAEDDEIIGFVQLADSLIDFANQGDSEAYNYIDKLNGKLQQISFTKNQAYLSTLNILSFFPAPVNTPEGTFEMTKIHKLFYDLSNSQVADLPDGWKYQIWTAGFPGYAPVLLVDELAGDYKNDGKNTVLEGKSKEFIDDLFTYYLYVDVVIAPPGVEGYSGIVMSRGFWKFENAN